MTTQAFAIYSPNESAISDGAGFWRNDIGWVTQDQAQAFTAAEVEATSMPISTGQDARWVPVDWTMRSASEVAEQFGHVGMSSVHEICTRQAAQGTEVLRVCDVGEHAYFEWINEDGDPVGDMFYAIPSTLKIDGPKT